MSRVAFCFPGQGSQRVGMGQELAAEYPESRAVFDEATDRLGFAASSTDLASCSVMPPIATIGIGAAARAAAETRSRPTAV